MSKVTLSNQFEDAGNHYRVERQGDTLYVYHVMGNPYFREPRKVYFRKNAYGKAYAQFRLPAWEGGPMRKVSIPPQVIWEVMNNGQN